ncbi:MAG: hypothetical protein LUD16_03605 [Lachnospiraceae bacterium]|nr:hypothetical protein [Lachnospiraceae bacterium]
MLYALYYPQAIKPEDTISECSIPFTSAQPFQFTIERMRHYMGAWHSVTAVLFPDYLFVDCEKEAAEKVRGKLEAELNRDKEIKQQLPLVPISDELSDLLNDLCDGEHHIPMSRGIIKDGLAHVTEGPLIGYDNQIIRIDRHKRLAWLKYSDAVTRNFAKDSTSALVAGLEITERIS